MLDILQNEVKKGDIIAYATRDGNSAALRLGYVYQLNMDDTINIYVLGGGYVRSNIDKLKKTKLYYGNRLIIIENNVPEDSLINYIIEY